MIKKTRLSSLPNEIENLIITYLTPSAAIALSRVNRYYNHHVSLHSLPKTTVSNYLHALELTPKDLQKQNHACYTCLHLEPLDNFHFQDTSGPQGKSGTQWSARRCMLCTGQKPRKLMCRACCKPHPDFCHKCRWCRHCIHQDMAVGQSVVAKRKTRRGNLKAVVLRSECDGHEWCPYYQRKLDKLVGRFVRKWADGEVLVQQGDADGEDPAVVSLLAELRLVGEKAREEEKRVRLAAA
ncbi:MAG: hypothetical protein L6R42_007934 [Xanthoria sp. 1 TBL-2021]|nr:MAG: hypothetical protein L6R42_007934 [Xanthoria sp. 1 TBL-2021]